jgi:hypothetical protein
MAKTSKYVKLDKNILLEYIYDDSNNLTESYDILVNNKDKSLSYIATPTSVTGNTQGNQLFRVDAVSNRYGKVNPEYYSFLQLKNFSSGTPLRHDTVKIHLPVNWTFGEYIGFYIKVYTFDVLNQQTYDISNFYFDMTDISQQYLMGFTAPPLLFQEKLWGKNITINIPSVNAVASQRVNNLPKEDSLNSNLTNGSGLNLNSPIFIDFQFLTSVQTINGISTYLVAPKITTSIPQTPEFENLSLMIKNSPNGDFFEIFGTYNGTSTGFAQFINDSYFQGNRYYVQYDITIFEQNIRGKTITTVVTEDFSEPIDFRPIIKFSTTTAIIDVEMRLIDAVDDSYIIRRASYGMLQDEVSKYSLKLIKINLDKANKPKIYNIKNSVDPALVGLSNSMGSLKLKKLPPMPANQISAQNAGTILGTSTNIQQVSQSLATSTLSPNTGGLISNAPSNVSNTVTPTANTTIQTVEVPFPVLIDRYNIIAKSENALFDSKTFYGNGKIQILVYPFDNIFRFSVASGLPTQPEYFDLSGFSEIKFIIRNDKTEVSFPLYIESQSIDLKRGELVFKVSQNKFIDIKKIYDSGINVFYIIGSNKGNTSVIYTGLFKLFDDKQNVAQLNAQAADIVRRSNQEPAKQEIKLDTSIKSEIKDLSKSNISNEIEPTKKPNLVKDLLSKGLKVPTQTQANNSSTTNIEYKNYSVNSLVSAKSLAANIKFNLDEFKKINNIQNVLLPLKPGTVVKLPSTFTFKSNFLIPKK